MSHGLPSLPRIQEHLRDLRLQEEDARAGLARPEAKPGVHSQLRALLQRIEDERLGILKSLDQNTNTVQ
jgi:hypothetical protein